MLVCTGGLGPTTDDITTECAARAWPASGSSATRRRSNTSNSGCCASAARWRLRTPNRPIFRSARASCPTRTARLRASTSGSGRPTLTSCPAYRRKSKAMFDTHVAPGARVARHASTPAKIVLRCFGLPESEVNDRLAGVEATYGVVIGYRASLPEIEVKVLAQAASRDAALAIARVAADEVRARLGDSVYGEGFGSLPEHVGGLLADQGKTLAIAESCTGGLAAELLTRIPGSSRYFLGAQSCMRTKRQDRASGRRRQN